MFRRWSLGVGRWLEVFAILAQKMVRNAVENAVSYCRSLCPSRRRPVHDFKYETAPPRKRLLWKWSLALTAAVLVVLLWQCGSGLSQGRELSAAAVRHFHAQLNQAEFAEIWAQSEEELQNTGQQQDFVDFLSAVHRLLPRAIPMQHFHPIPCLPKALTNIFGDHHRAMLPAGAAERDREIAFSFPNIVRQQVNQQLRNPLDELARLRKRANVFCDLRITASKRPE